MSTDSAVTPAVLEEFLGNRLTYSDRGDFGLDHARLIPTADAPRGAILRVAYPAGSASRAAGGTTGGMQAYLRLPDPVDALDLRYRLRFPTGFDFVKGGKLPGLYGGSVTSGRRIPDGTNGFSTRYMWRTCGDGEVYAYLPSSRTHGTSLGRGCWSFTPGSWTVIDQRVQLNTPGRDDGEIAVRQDGRLVLRQTGLEFRTTDRLRIEGLFFSTFFGGADPSWATPVDQHVDFADFTLSTAPAAATGPSDGATAECTAGDHR
jgi:hypothetical protein